MLTSESPMSIGPLDWMTMNEYQLYFAEPCTPAMYSYMKWWWGGGGTLCKIARFLFQNSFMSSTLHFHLNLHHQLSNNGNGNHNTMDNGTGDDYTLNVKPLQVFLSNKRKLEIAEKVLNSWDDQPTNQLKAVVREEKVQPNQTHHWIKNMTSLLNSTEKKKTKWTMHSRCHTSYSKGGGEIEILTCET